MPAPEVLKLRRNVFLALIKVEKMKKILWIIVVLVFIGYFVHLHLKESAKHKGEKAEQAEQKRNEKEIEKEIKTAIGQMVSKTNAVEDWVQNLCDGKGGRLTPILTVELEKLWLNKRPILFIGTIQDIATYDQSQYTVIIKKNLLDFSECLFLSTELQLSLRSPKEKIDSLLTNYPNISKGLGFNNGIAVVAQVENINTTYIRGESGERQEIKIGEGKLVEILYTGKVLF